jgi:hypothetical protein
MSTFANIRKATIPKARTGRPSANICLLVWTVFGINSAPLHAASKGAAIDYVEPRLLIGSIYGIGAEPKALLFRSERRAAETNSQVLVTCDYTYPNGSLAAHDRIIYEAGQLASFEETELQTNEKGSAIIRADPKNPGKRRIYFEYTTGQGSEAKKCTDSELLEKDTLVDDMISGFIESNWASLEKGESCKFRYIVLSRKETVGFKFVKDSETVWHGKRAVRIKMEPTSIIIAQLVDPLFFVVERDAPHRILEYTGRTTPLIKSGNKWKDLDAVCVFDWNLQEAAKAPMVSGAPGAAGAPR